MATARYLLKAPTYVPLAPGLQPRTLANEARSNNPVPIDIDEAVDPSRTWLPCNVAAQRALARLGVTAEIVRENRRVEARDPANTMQQIAGMRAKVVGRETPRASDTDPITGQPATTRPEDEA